MKSEIRKYQVLARPSGDFRKRSQKGMGFILNGSSKDGEHRSWLAKASEEGNISIDEAIYLADIYKRFYKQFGNSMSQMLEIARENTMATEGYKEWFAGSERAEWKNPSTALFTLNPLIMIPSFYTTKDLLNRERRDVLRDANGAEKTFRARLTLLSSEGYYAIEKAEKEIETQEAEYLGTIEEVRTFFKGLLGFKSS